MKLTNRGVYTTCGTGKEFEIHQWIDKNGICKAKALIPNSQLDYRKHEMKFINQTFNDLKSLYDHLETLRY